MPAQGNPTPPLVGGISQRDTIFSKYVFQSGVHKPEHSSILSYKYPQYYLTSLLDQLGASEGIPQDVWSWNTMDRTRLSYTQTGAGTISTTTATIDVDAPTFAVGYAVVGDVVRTETGRNGIITAVNDNSTVLELVIESEDGANWTAAEIADGKVFGHIYNSFAEGSDAPKGRLYLPDEDYNYLTILRRSFKITGSEFTNRTWLGNGEAWYFTQEDLEMKEFARDRELLTMFGSQVNDAANNRKSSRGIIDWALNEGVINTYASGTGIAESDLQAHIRDMIIEGVSNEITVLCGANAMADIQVALKDYAIDGAQSYDGKVAGLDFQAYRFMGKKVNFAYYELFDDTAALPTPSATLTDAIKDFSHFTLWLDMGADSTGKKLISLKHKELDGQSRKFIHSYEVGMMNPYGENGGMVSNGVDAFQIHYLSEIGPEVRLPNRLGVLAANS